MDNNGPAAFRAVSRDGQPLIICDVHTGLETHRILRALERYQRYPFKTGRVEPWTNLREAIRQRPSLNNPPFLAAVTHFTAQSDRATASETVMNQIARIVLDDSDADIYFDPAVVAAAPLSEMRQFFAETVGIGRQGDLALHWWHNCRRVHAQFDSDFSRVFHRIGTAPRALAQLSSAPKRVKARAALKKSRLRRIEIGRLLKSAQQELGSMFLDAGERADLRQETRILRAERDQLLVAESDALMDWFMGFGPVQETKTGRLCVLRHHREVKRFRGIRMLGMPVDYHVIRLVVALGILREWDEQRGVYTPLRNAYYKNGVIPIIVRALTEVCQLARADSRAQVLWWMYGNRVCSDPGACIRCGFRKLGRCTQTISAEAYYGRGVIQPIELPVKGETGEIRLDLDSGVDPFEEEYYLKGGALLGERTPIWESDSTEG